MNDNVFMSSTFREDDVTLLLKDISGLVTPLPTKEREQKIQSGIHYSEMLPEEYRPSEEYLKIYTHALKTFGKPTANAAVQVSEKIYRKKGKNVVIVSLARAGTPIGILVKRYLKRKYGCDCPHYSISIIRDKGIDENAIDYILRRHDSQNIQFVDGWVGKGVIYRELVKKLAKYTLIPTDLAVLADPAYLTEMCGTHEDILIPSSCLNSTVCGLISRTFLRNDIIKAGDFHGAAFYGELESEDRTYEFIDHIEDLYEYNQEIIDDPIHMIGSGVIETENIAHAYGIDNINYVKPGIGETTRVLLRRVPWKVLIDQRFRESQELEHVIRLAEEKGVNIEYCSMNNYKCCGLIRKLSDV